MTIWDLQQTKMFLERLEQLLTDAFSESHPDKVRKDFEIKAVQNQISNFEIEIQTTKVHVEISF